MDEYSTPEFYKSTKQRVKFSYRGYRYHRDRVKGDREYWKCEDRSCKGLAITKNSDIVSVSEHAHGPNQAETVIQMAVGSIKSSSESTHEAPSSLINRELSQGLPTELRGYFPKETNIKRTVQRMRNKRIPALPKCLGDISISDKWAQTVEGEEWLICNKTLTGNNKLLIFCNARSFSCLIGAKVWYGDGTFGIAPQHFYQLYTLHAPVGGQLMPLCYCLLSSKSAYMYEEMFKSIKEIPEERSLEIKLESFRPDYERAAIEAVKTVFQIDKIEGCFFHLSQAHWRKIQELGLRTLYTENENISVSARMLTALAFCPVSDVDIAFKELQENLPEPLNPMIEYMERTYIGGTTFSSKIVNGRTVSLHYT